MEFGKKQLVLASLVLALGAAVYLNWQFAGTQYSAGGDTSSETSQLGAAQLVNNAYVETVTDDLQSSTETATQEDALAQARVDRQNSRTRPWSCWTMCWKAWTLTALPSSKQWRRPLPLPRISWRSPTWKACCKPKDTPSVLRISRKRSAAWVMAGSVEEADTLIVQEIVMEQTGLSADKIKIIGTN